MTGEVGKEANEEMVVLLLGGEGVCVFEWV
jgi:hypothetical protein